MVSVVCCVEFVGKGDDVWELVGWEDERACEDVVFLLIGLEGEGRNDAEVCAGAADGPEEIWV